MVRFIAKFRSAVWLALAHDVLNTAKASAYSGMLLLFPLLALLAAAATTVPAGNSLVLEMRGIFEQFLPRETMTLIQLSMQAPRVRSVQIIFSAATLSLFGAVGLMLSLMEGFRRAYRLPREDWGLWQRHVRALMLIPISLGPLAIATMVLVFGRPIEAWMIRHGGHELRMVVLIAWRLARWTVAAITSISVLMVLYHFGTRRTEHWGWVAPGAITATAVWFPATLAFGWYVTHIADYSLFYGSFGAGIATLVWLYLTCFSALLGSELNGVLYRDRQMQDMSITSTDPE